VKRVIFEHRQPYTTFAPGCMDDSLGKSVPVKYDGRIVGEGILIFAAVIEDGQALKLTLDVTDDSFAGVSAMIPAELEFSIGAEQ
jgi:hypothetical protein